MKKLLMYAGGYAVLEIVNSEILTGLVLVVISVALLCKYFPMFMEGTK